MQVETDGHVYILDFGVFDTGGKKPRVMPKSGKVFRVEPESARVSGGGGFVVGGG